MSICDDPFAVLGVAREASPAEVKRAYRRLAMHWHPDRNPSAAAAAQFQRVHAAYELCLDPQRLAEWQQAQAATPTTATTPAPADDDLVQVLKLTLEEAARGCRKAVDLVQRVGCASCRGNGRVQHDHLVPCFHCSGCGRVAREGGRTNRCGGCAGRGYVRETECPACTGNGWREARRTLSVTVPPALLAGERLRLARQAPPGRDGAVAGDLYLEIGLEPHPLFALRGRDLHCEVPVSIFRLLCGGYVEVPTLSGTVALQLSPFPAHPLEYRLSGQGFPDKPGRAAGDLVVHLQSIFPAGVGAQDADLLERLERRLSAEIERRAPPLAAWEGQMRARRQPSG